jgi:hypothetical protein
VSRASSSIEGLRTAAWIRNPVFKGSFKLLMVMLAVPGCPAFSEAPLKPRIFPPAFQTLASPQRSRQMTHHCPAELTL